MEFIMQTVTHEETSTTVAARIPVEKRRELERAAAEEKRPLSQIIEFAIDDYIEKRREKKA
jgi:predicted transcriptional regulator